MKERGYTVSCMGGTSRTGRWVPARNNYGVGVMGGFSLDFHEDMLGPGETEVNVFVLMGGGEIIVPPEMEVEVRLTGETKKRRRLERKGLQPRMAPPKSD